MHEQFSYSLMASALGILIVFSILVLLSCLMILIRKLSDTDPKEKTKTAKTSSQKKAAVSSQLPLPVMVAAATAGYPGSSNWLIAAVAAFFATEDDNTFAPRATSWTSTPGKYDPWVANNKLSKTVPGA